jgi:hypothetical protein
VFPSIVVDGLCPMLLAVVGEPDVIVLVVPF